jgi:energy-coupling factor transport system ATP-binding protein
MITCRSVHFSYGNGKVLEDISLTIAEGEITAVTGKNGSGKSTFALLLCGMLQPDGGRLTVDGEEMGATGEGDTLRRRIGIVFENPDNQFVTTSVEREIAFGLENQGIEAEQIRERVAAMIDRFSLNGIRDRAPHTLSGGEKQRVAIAAAIIARPRYLILDEPTVYLDPAARAMVNKEVCNLKGTVTIIYITQFPREILLADTVYELRNGQIEGPIDKATCFSRFRAADDAVRFLHELGSRGIFDGYAIPEVDHLCSMLEEQRKKV